MRDHCREVGGSSEILKFSVHGIRNCFQKFFDGELQSGKQKTRGARQIWPGKTRSGEKNQNLIIRSGSLAHSRRDRTDESKKPANKGSKA